AAAMRRQQLCMGALANADLEDIPTGKIRVGNDLIKRLATPWQKILRSPDEATIDFLEIATAEGLVLHRLTPVITHRGGFPPRLVGALPVGTLILISRQPGRRVKAFSLVGEGLAREILDLLCHLSSQESYRPGPAWMLISRRIADDC